MIFITKLYNEFNLILIKNASVINLDGISKSDILIENGKIKQIKNQINNAESEVINANGKYVLPGGIDPHVHMELPTPAGMSADDFETGSLAALAGGTTTLIDFVTPGKGESLIKALAERKKLTEKSKCNIYLHMSIIDWHAGIEQEIEQCIEEENIRSFKVYMAYQNSIGISEEILNKVLSFLANKNVVVLVHCEIDSQIEALKKQFLLQGKTEAIYHPMSRPEIAEVNAVDKVIQLVEKTGCPVYVVHVSSEMAIKKIRNAQQKGLKIYAETCPQYLLLNDGVYNQNNQVAINYILSPPLRKQKDNIALWKGIDNSVVSTIGTDHCPFTKEQKNIGLSDFTKVPNGVGGVEHRMELLNEFGVKKGKISLQKWVEIASYNAAKIFQIPYKGMIAEGYDADLVIWNPEIEKTISVTNHHQNCDFNIYEGIKVTGKAEIVIVKGNVLRN
ncbi:MAG: dihydropyrimidinase [Chlorobi bacterium]|nr:dihydropyrimidinase [Chlorobiota bacterium]